MNEKNNQGLAWLVGVLWLFGVAILVLMGLSTAAAIMFMGLFGFASFMIFYFRFFGHAPRRASRPKANRNAGKTYRVQAATTRKTLHERR